MHDKPQPKPIEDKMTTPLGRTDLQSFIDTHHLSATILPMDATTATVADAAKALGVAIGMIIKSLLFIADDQPILVINSGPARVDRKKLATHLGLNRKQVKFAKAGQAFAITGYVVGSMPPFGHRQPLKTLVDTSATELETVYGGGGDIDAMMRVSLSELILVTHADITNLSE